MDTHSGSEEGAGLRVARLRPRPGYSGKESVLWLSVLTGEVTWLPSDPDLAAPPTVSSAVSARLGSGEAEDTRVLLTELLRRTRFSRAAPDPETRRLLLVLEPRRGAAAALLAI